MRKILIIEDDRFVQSMLRQTIEKAGYLVETADNGSIGLDLFGKQAFDAVITDLIMPETEGIETICKMKKINAGVKVIAISGGGRNRPEDYLFLAEKLGACYTFSKPVDRKQLLAALRSLVGD